MNWINNVALPKFNSFFQRRDMPENLWRKCDACEQMIHHRRLKKNLYVCPELRGTTCASRRGSGWSRSTTMVLTH